MGFWVEGIIGLNINHIYYLGASQVAHCRTGKKRFSLSLIWRSVKIRGPQRRLRWGYLI